MQSAGSAGDASGDEVTPGTSGTGEAVAKAGVIHLKTADFKEKVFNYEKNPETWVFEGERPCIVDFYADWCKPCKLIAPIMEELSVKYAGQIDIYKVNTDNEKELAAVFGIRSIPSVLFVPASGRPQMTQGALPKETFEEVIQNFLLNPNPEGATAE
ncbi:MAG: thioredoxin [Bacteroidales bacterium]|nr:thioredoxin [Bacteroidales bacterium]